MHSNAILLIEKTRQGTFYSEGILLMQTIEMSNRINWRKDGNADQRERYTPEEIKALKKGGNENFANKTHIIQ